MNREDQKKQDKAEAVVAEVFARFSYLQQYRSNFGIQWEEVAELIWPEQRNTFFYGDYNMAGVKKTDRQVDSTGMVALNRFGAICDSLLTPRNMIWHMLEATDDDLKKDRATRVWYENTVKKLFKYRYMPDANFTANNQMSYKSMGAFGNGITFIDKLRSHTGNIGLRYKSIPTGEMFFMENHQGMVDGFVRWFRMTARQAAQKWGMENLPETIQEAAKRGTEDLHMFLHYVLPRDDYDPERLDERSLLYASHYISVDGRKLLSSGGYNTFPVALGRYDQAPGETYGRGPAMHVLPTLKTLNAEKRTFLRQGHRAADPVLLTADDGIVDFSLRPGALNKGGVSADGKPLIQVLPAGNIQVTKEMMDEERALINDAFFVSLFQILTESPQMTATEVIERVNEKGILLAPTIGRQMSEYLGPMIDRELDLLSQMGLLDPMPPALAELKGDYHVVYTSPLARAQRAQEVSGALRTLETVKELVAITGDPSLLDPFNFDTMIPDMARIQATPEAWLAGADEIAQKRQARAKQQAAQQQIQAAPAQAAMMKAQAAQAKAGVPQQQGQAVQ
ncbi:MAG: head-tail connector protein [Patescibacteria group bacterium]|nr:head-tail connector protein [Patescibacteria group bacterium]